MNWRAIVEKRTLGTSQVQIIPILMGTSQAGKHKGCVAKTGCVAKN